MVYSRWTTTVFLSAVPKKVFLTHPQRNGACVCGLTCCLSCVSCSFISSHLRLDSVASFSSWSITAQSHSQFYSSHRYRRKCLRFYLCTATGYLLLVFAKKTDHQKKNMHRGCTHKVSLSLLLLLNLFHHFSDSLQLGVHKLLLQLLVLEHLVYMLPGIHQISIRLDDLWYALLWSELMNFILKCCYLPFQWFKLIWINTRLLLTKSWGSLLTLVKINKKFSTFALGATASTSHDMKG